MKTVREVMTKDVETVVTTTRLQTAAQKMRDLNIGFLIVEDDTGAIGCLTDRDIVVEAVAKGMDTKERRVGEVMTGHVVSCSLSTKVKDAAQMMKSHHVHRLVVLDDGKRPVGVVTLGDLAARTDMPSDVHAVLRELAQSAA